MFVDRLNPVEIVFKTRLLSVLPELPLPKPTSTAQSNKSLISNAQLQLDAKQVLHDVDDVLVPTLVTALRSTHTSDM